MGALACYREIVVVERSNIERQGLFGSKRLDPATVTQLRWRRWPKRGSVVLTSSGVALTIDFASFSAEDRRDLIERVRSMFTPEIQQGWSKFASACFPEQTDGRRASPVLMLTVAALLAATGGVMIYLWAKGAAIRYFILGSIHVLAAGGCLIRAGSVARQR
jgi:hypothetical protein